MRSSASNTAATIQRASPRWKTATSRAVAPRASCAISKAGSRRSRSTGTIGIGHTRWATHGRPTENNAHPHATERLAVVHNGIIENFQELREELIKKGAKFRSETDTEVVAHLVTHEMKGGRSPSEAVAAALPRLRGAFALAFLFAGEDDLLIGARKGSPLAIGYGDGEMYLGSDAIALAPFTDTISYLEDGDSAVLTREGVEVHDAAGSRVERAVIKSTASAFLVDKGNHRHFMAKEIHEQPEVVGHTLAHYLDFAAERVRLPAELPFDFRTLQRISMSACGTAYYAGLVAKYWFERFARLPVEIDIASEFRYREAPLQPGGLAIFVSQSGETADTLATLALCQGAEAARALGRQRADLDHRARQRRGDADAGRSRDRRRLDQGVHLPACGACLPRGRGRPGARRAVRGRRAQSRPRTDRGAAADGGGAHARAADRAAGARARESRDVLYLGRGTSFPLALEGALKLKEISYIHAEGYAAGELKHGPIALIDETMPVIVIAPHDRVFEKTVSNMQEVAARGGRIILITDPAGARETHVKSLSKITLPDMPATVTPLVYAIPVQLIAYHTAVAMGTDVDQPRNLAKSVTVE